MNFLVQKKGAFFVFIFQKGHLAFSESVLVQIPTVPEKTVSRSFVFRLKLRSEKPRKRPIGCAFTRIRSKLTIIDGGAEGSRTPVRKHFDRTFSGRRTVSAFPPWAGTGQTAQFSRVMMHGRGNSYPPHVRHINDAFPGLWPLRFRRLPLVRQRQQYDCCQLILKLPVLRRSGAAARLSCLHTPVETGTAPYMG